MTPSEREILLDKIVNYIKSSPHWNSKERNFEQEAEPSSDFMFWIQTQVRPNGPDERLSDNVELNLAKFAIKEGQIFSVRKIIFWASNES